MAFVGRELSEVVSQYMNSTEFANRKLLTRGDTQAKLFELQGFKLYADRADAAVGCYVPTGNYEPHVTALFRREISLGQTVIDVGANIGYFSMLASSLVGSFGKVVAIEPSPSNCRLIEASRQANGFNQLSVHPVAAAPKSGLLALHSVYSNGAVSGVSDDFATLLRSQVVEGARLDDLLILDALDFIKIDVEGFEHDALAGFQDHIAKFRPKIVSEFTPSAMADPEAYLQFFFGQGYEVGVIVADGGVEYPEQQPHSIIEKQKSSGFPHIDIFAQVPKASPAG